MWHRKRIRLGSRTRRMGMPRVRHEVHAMNFCMAVTEVEGKAVICEKDRNHEGKHVGHIPSEKPGLMWSKHEWE